MPKWIRLVLAVIVVFGAAVADRGSAVAQEPVEIKLVFGTNVSPAHRELFQRYVPLVNPFFAKALGRPKAVPATIYVYPTLEERKQAFMEFKGVPAERAEVALRTGLAVAMRNQEIWYRMDDRCFEQIRLSEAGCNFVKILIHELFHTWQYEFVSNASDLTPRWFSEGSAEFVGYLGALELRVGLTRPVVDRYFADAARRRANVFKGLAPISTLVEWDAWSRVLAGDMYSIIGQAVFRLAEKQPAALATFYSNLKETGEWSGGFEKAFGRPFADFDREFTAYIQSHR